jgi:succinoglycan biosynthesis protein ExoL
MREVIFIVQQLSQPRCIKRIKNFIDLGYKVRVFGFNNGLYQVNLHQASFDVEETMIINKNSRKLLKVIKYFKFISYVLKTSKKEDVIYVFGFEIGVLLSFLYRGEFVYEEADVPAARVKHPLLRALMVYLDKRIIRKSQLTVFTSEGFQDYLFPQEKIYSHKTIFLHNKLHSDFRYKARLRPSEVDLTSISFGFVGLIRYPNTILRFAKIVGTHFPQHHFHFWGDAEGNILDNENWSQYGNLFFHGGFANPGDLAKIYSTIDINIACYDPASGNVRIAEPNKLYESIFFGKPIVVTADTYVHSRVESLGVGFGIDSLSDQSIIRFISNLTNDAILTCQLNCIKMNVDDLIDNPVRDMKLIKDYLL